MPTKVSKLFGFFNRLIIKRWQLMYSTREENVKEHSFDVSVIVHTLAILANTYFSGNYDPAKAVMFAVFHDTPEAITGDMPTPVKYFNPDVKAAADKVEALAIQKMVSCLPVEMRGEYEKVFNIPCDYKPLVKAADRIAALAKCLEEKKRGNDEFVRAELRHRKDLEETRKTMPEVGYFLDYFLPGFNLSIDQLCEGNGSWIIDGDADEPQN